MLVLNRKSGQFTNVKLNRENLKHLLESGEDAELRFRVYNVKNGQVDVAFDDPKHNFIIQRPERKIREN